MTQPNTIEDVLAFWESGDGRPYKGSLIDRNSYESDPKGLGCMCAQGQALVLSGKRTVQDLLNGLGQGIADKEVAEIWNISLTHSILLRTVNDRVDGAPAIVITNPEKVLGDKWSKLLDFWWMFHCCEASDWQNVKSARDAARVAAGIAAWDAARVAAWDAARDAAGIAARDAAWDAAWDAARVTGVAAAEIQGFDLLEKHPHLNAFGIASLDDIPPRPANYGNGFVPRGAA